MGMYQKLSYLQARRSLAAALVLGLVFSTLQIVVDLYDQRIEANKTITQVINIVHRTATQAVYNVNEPMAWKVVNGLFQYRPVYLVRIIDDELHENMAERERPKTTGGIPWLAHYILPNDIFIIPLRFNGEDPPIGRLHVEVDNILIAWSFLMRTGWIIVAGLLRNILLALLLLYIFHATLTRPLLKLINDLAKLDPSSSAGHRVPVAPPHQHNELGLLASTLNKLLAAIEESNRNRQLADKARYEADKARSEAEAVSREKSIFLANMSHEIRTPMNGILGMAQLLSKADLEPKHRHQIELLVHSGEILLRLIDDVLNASKLSAEKMVLENTSFDLHHTIENTALIFSEMARQQALSFTYSYDPNLPRNVTGDNFRLQQILNNLLGNAIKFTLDGRVSLRVVPGGSTGEILIIVSDDGIGIPPGKRKELFEPFTQMENITNRQFGGTGLGLSISRRLARLMGGDIQLESTLGKGSVFTFSLPLSEHSDQSSADPLISQPVIKAPEQGVEILIVEDNIISQKVLHAFLDELKCRTTIAGDGEQALAFLREKRFDLVLMDCQMPKMDGIAACRAFRELERERGTDGRRTPVIALTAYARSEDRERCLEAGMDDFITKPVAREALPSILFNWTKNCLLDKQSTRS